VSWSVRGESGESWTRTLERRGRLEGGGGVFNTLLGVGWDGEEVALNVELRVLNF
jgi:hypothetical protein